MGVACGSDAAFCVLDDGTNAAAVRLQVNEFRLNAPTSEGWLVSEVQQALVYFDVILAFDVGGFEFVHGFVV